MCLKKFLRERKNVISSQFPTDNWIIFAQAIPWFLHKMLLSFCRGVFPRIYQISQFSVD